MKAEMSQYLTSEIDASNGIMTVTMDDPSGSTNRTTDQFKTELSALLDSLAAKPVAGVILLSAKRDFGVGGDVDQIAELAAQGAKSCFDDSQRIKALFRRIETLGFPVVALIEGMAVGGSFELALACHARFALDDDQIRLGFPETSIGLVPGAGGLVRTVNMIGLEKAIPLVVEAKLINPAEAAKLGLIDGVGSDRATLLQLAAHWILSNPQVTKPWDEKRHKVPGGGLFAVPGRYLKMQGQVAAANKRGFGHQMAEVAALGALCEIASAGFSDGEILESRVFARQARSDEATARIGLNLKDKSVLRRAPSRPREIAPATLPQTVGIIGAGMMGAGIAYANARVGISVKIADVSHEAALGSMKQITADADRAVRRGEYDSVVRDAVLARVEVVKTLDDLAGCDLMVEAVFEDLALKKDVITKLEKLVAPGGVIASNTSALSISDIGAGLENPDRFIGLHFFSPVDRMHLVEIVVGAKTSDSTLAYAHDYVRALKKLPITVADSNGFFASRVFQKLIYEAAALVGEGVPAAMIENAALQAGYPAGPLALIDDTALTLSVRIIDGAAAVAAAKGLPPENHPGEKIIKSMVNDHKREGRRAGAGFYDYQPEGKVLWPGLAELGSKTTSPALSEISERYLTAQCCDVLRCLAEGIIWSAAEVNAGAIRAIGFPAWTGGPLRLIEAEGAGKFLTRSRELASQHGARFALPFKNTDELQAVLDAARQYDLDAR